MENREILNKIIQIDKVYSESKTTALNQYYVDVNKALDVYNNKKKLASNTYNVLLKENISKLPAQMVKLIKEYGAEFVLNNYERLNKETGNGTK